MRTLLKTGQCFGNHFPLLFTELDKKGNFRRSRLCLHKADGFSKDAAAAALIGYQLRFVGTGFKK
jgi:hypothetical protein